MCYFTHTLYASVSFCVGGFVLYFLARIKQDLI